MARGGGSNGTNRFSGGGVFPPSSRREGTSPPSPARNELARSSRPAPIPGDLDWPHRRVWLGRLPLDPVKLTEAVDTLSALVESGHGGSVFLPTADSLVLADRDAGMQAALNRAELCLADGQRLMWAAETLGQSLPGEVPALELLPPLLKHAARLRWRVFMVGEHAEQLEASAAHLEKLYGIRVVGTFAPTLRHGVDDDVVEQTARAVLRTSPQLVLTSLRSPAQELLLDRIKDRIRPGVVVGLGTALRAAVGGAWRVPKWAESVGLGWLVRLFGGPRRLGRRGLLSDARFLWVFARVLLRGGRKQGSPAAEATENR